MSGQVETKRITFDDGVVRKFLFASMGWGLVGMLVGVIVATQLLFHQANVAPMLSFGRLRPLHTNAVIFAFVGNMIFAGIYYSTQRLLKARMASDALSKFHFWGWQAIIVAAAITLPLGLTQGKEYAELEWPIDLAIAVVWVAFAINFFWTLKVRREKHLYVAIWFYIATIITVAVLHVVNSFAIPLNIGKSYSVFAGVQDALVQWWYGHNAVAFFLTTPVLGIMYYFLPKAAGRPVYSYRLSIVHFWALVFMYIWAGPHHLLYTALPNWAQTVGMVFSLMLWAPSWGGMINGLLTLRGGWDKLRQDPVIKFLVAGVTFYGMATFEGPLLSIKSVSALAHYTDWIIGHVHTGALGWNGLMAAGMFYWLVPKLFNKKLHSTTLANVHFWMATFGILFYMSSMWAAGITQGLMLRATNAEGALVYPDFIETVVAIRWLYAARLLGGTLYLIGFMIMAFNLVKTALAGQATDGEIEVVELIQTKAEPRWTEIIVSKPVALLAIGLVTTIAMGIADIAPAVLLFFVFLALVVFAWISWDTGVDKSKTTWHQILEGRPLLFTVLTVIAVLIGGIVEIVPTVVLKENNANKGQPPSYTGLELEGRDIYLREGCYTCHSQMIRPFKDEYLRYGEPSKLQESAYDHPFQWGSKRTGPDLARVGGKYPHSWHAQHMIDPRSLSPKSIMPGYAFLKESKVDTEGTAGKLQVMKTLGVPYTDQAIRSASADAKSQATKIAKELAEQGTKVNADSELVALIAYLQSLGQQPTQTAPAKTPVAHR
jgi:cytochrome c oxidase cbb3-type subunit I/II